MMTADHWEMALRLGVALAAGALIGMERSYSGRAAGFRTHALVCVSTALLMLVPAFDSFWIDSDLNGRLVLDPTRMAQGIMTGIGFLGAGAILKSGLSIHGLTTAASIWMTAAIGILAGAGYYFAVIAGTIITLSVLTFFQWIESLAPTRRYAECVVRFAAGGEMPEAEVRALVSSAGFGVDHVHYRASKDEGYYEYRMIIRTTRPKSAARLNETLRALPSVREFRLTPTTD